VFGIKTQKEIADRLDMSERNLRDVLKALNLDHRVNSFDEILIAYIRDLREKAAGRGGDAAGELTRARILETMANYDLKTLLVKEKAGELLLVDDVEPQLIAMVAAARTELLSLPSKLVAEIKALHGVDVDAALIQESIYESLNHLATSLHDDDAGDDVAGDESVGATAEAEHNGMVEPV